MVPYKTTTFQNVPPFFSIVMPIHNQAAILRRNVQSLLDMTTGRPYEIIFVVDACSDATLPTLQEWLMGVAAYPWLIAITVAVSDDPLFETAADNVGFRLARGDYLLEIQADMTMTEPGYNMRLLQPFLLDPTMIGVSGRCCHTFDGRHGVGKLGRQVLTPVAQLPHVDRQHYYVSQTCNRGPLLLDHAKTRELGYLDEAHYFLDNSDHDLFLRAFLRHGYRCAYVPIDFESPLEHGSTRKPRDAKNQAAYVAKQAQMRAQGPTFLDQHRFTATSVAPQAFPLFVSAN